MAKLISAREAAALVRDKSVLAVGGFGAYCGPDALLQALADRHKATASPAGLTIVAGISPGNNSDDPVGMNRIADESMVDTVIAAHLGNARCFARMVAENKIAAYLLPLGVLVHLFRAAAGKKPGVLTRVGLGTYADPEQEGCRINEKAHEKGWNAVQPVVFGGERCLFYPSFSLDICFLRGTYADEDGNISVEHEGLTGAELEIAAAVHNNGGTVVVQVEDIVRRGSIHPRKVRIHGALVDYVVKAPKPELHMQSYAADGYQPALTGETRGVTAELEPMEMGIRKVIARRAAMELRPDCVINLGIGLPSGVGAVANEEGLADQITLSLESGPVGGVPVEGIGFAGSVNPEAILSICDTFDLYDGGFLDMTFLGAAEIDEEGNVNASRFGAFCHGPGGFINISQNAPKVFFMSTFTAGKGKTKFVKKVQQVTFSADYARKSGQEVMYITERAVFRLGKEGLVLTEIASGMDLERDILSQMEFRPLIADQLSYMDERIFRASKMKLWS